MNFMRWIRKFLGWHDWVQFDVLESDSRDLAEIVRRMTFHHRYERCSICGAESIMRKSALAESAWRRHPRKDSPLLQCKYELIRQVLNE